jgi:hypothetical protein
VPSYDLAVSAPYLFRPSLLSILGSSSSDFPPILQGGEDISGKNEKIWGLQKDMGEAALLATVLTRGVTVCAAVCALENKRWAACTARVGLSRHSRAWPAESTTRYTDLPVPFPYTSVSSTRQASVVVLR